MPNITPQFVLKGDYCWTTTAVFPSWKGFQSRRGAYGAQDQADPSDGTVQIVFAPEGRGIKPLSASEIASVVWVIENETSISEALISSLLKEYPALQEQYGYSDEEKAELMPDIKSADDLRSLVGLYAVNIHQVQKDGIPYAGFEFGCTWDDEHGLGVLMHGTRAVDIGGADTAFLLWIAEQDGGVQVV
ncbi:MAG: hypothetical protein ABSC48_18805 [Terracidiphilus sp.]|jgi:hypothetical protein